MYFDQHRATDRSHLRLVFNRAVLSSELAHDATYGDVARMFNETTRMRHGNPIAINVTLGPCAAPPPRRSNGAMSVHY